MRNVYHSGVLTHFTNVKCLSTLITVIKAQFSNLPSSYFQVVQVHNKCNYGCSLFCDEVIIRSKIRHASKLALFSDFNQSAVWILSVLDVYLRCCSIVAVNYFLRFKCGGAATLNCPEENPENTACTILTNSNQFQALTLLGHITMLNILETKYLKLLIELIRCSTSGIFIHFTYK